VCTADEAELQQDPLIRSHLSVLYDTLLEQNLVRVIEPYSSVQLTWIAQEVGQDVQVVEEKLSQMILDQVFYGVLNENEGTLEIHDQPTEDVSFSPLAPRPKLIVRSCSQRR
jgi:26S proteasome regulatory subunit N6